MEGEVKYICGVCLVPTPFNGAERYQVCAQMHFTTRKSIIEVEVDGVSMRKGEAFRRVEDKSAARFVSPEVLKELPQLSQLVH
jgi:trehalose-6-phosphatase